jgi:MFS transporter, FHS family, Na+ dependent glucose transporter 1
MQTKSHSGNPYVTTAVYYLGFICLGMAAAVLGPTLQGLASQTGSSLAQISSLFSVNSFGYLLGSFVAGRVFDRVKGHPILCLALLGVALMLGFVPLAPALIFLQAIFFVLGLAQGHIDVGINTLIVWLHGERVPPFMNGLHAFYGIGMTTAPLIVAAVLGSMGSLTSVYWILAILIVPIGLLTIFQPSPSHILARQQAENRPAVPLAVFLLAVIFFAFTGAELGFSGWIYTYSSFQTYVNPTMAASINAAFGAALTIGRVISIPISVKLNSKTMLWINFSGTIVSLLILIFLSTSEVFLWLGTIGTGLFMASTFPTLLNDAQSRMHLSGKITSVFFVGSSLGSMTIPWIMGQLITPYGAQVIMITILCSILVATGMFYILNTMRFTAPTPPLKISKNE